MSEAEIPHEQDDGLPSGRPEHGPGGTEPPEHRVVPLFPLPDLILFPGQVQPLMIFETRYRQMVRDLLDVNPELVLGTVLGEDKKRMAEVAPVQPVAGLGRIEQYRSLPDGRFVILVLGTRRVLVRPLEGDHLYPVCEIEPLPLEQEVIVDPIRRTRYEVRLRSALTDCWREDSPPPEGVPLFQLADLLQMHMEMAPEQRYRIYATRPLEARIESLLELATR
jgi:Lon protease-like protein